MNNTGVHRTHCCARHGCKYGDEDCPVVSGEVVQAYDCELCVYDKEQITANNNMEIKIEQYLSEEDMKNIVAEEVRKHVRNCIGEISVSGDKGRVLISKMAKDLAKEGVQEIIPDFKELINEHIRTEIKNVKLSDFFLTTFGWKSEGNKVLNAVLTDNKPLLDAKIKELFKVLDT